MWKVALTFWPLQNWRPFLTISLAFTASCLFVCFFFTDFRLQESFFYLPQLLFPENVMQSKDDSLGMVYVRGVVLRTLWKWSALEIGSVRTGIASGRAATVLSLQTICVFSHLQVLRSTAHLQKRTSETGEWHRPLSVFFIVLETTDIPLFFSCPYKKVPWYKELHRSWLSPMSEANTGLCICHSWQLILIQAQMASARLDRLKHSNTDADTFSVFLSSTPNLPLRTGLTAYSSFADWFLAPSIVLSFIFFLLIVNFYLWC